jgi:hypothetical protein
MLEMKLDWTLFGTTSNACLLDQRFKTNCNIHSLRGKRQSCQVITMLNQIEERLNLPWALFMRRCLLFKSTTSVVFSVVLFPCVRRYRDNSLHGFACQLFWGPPFLLVVYVCVNTSGIGWSSNFSIKNLFLRTPVNISLFLFQ